jgi:hypothetical protein
VSRTQFARSMDRWAVNRVTYRARNSSAAQSPIQTQPQACGRAAGPPIISANQPIHRQLPRATPAAPPRRTTECAAPRPWCATKDAAAHGSPADLPEMHAHGPSSHHAPANAPERSLPPAASTGSPASTPAACPATTSRIPDAAPRRRRWAGGRDSRTPSERSRRGSRRRMCRNPSAVTPAAGRRTDRSTECRSDAPWCPVRGQRSAGVRRPIRGTPAVARAAGARHRPDGRGSPPPAWPARQVVVPRRRSSSTTRSAGASGDALNVANLISGASSAS